MSAFVSFLKTQLCIEYLDFDDTYLGNNGVRLLSDALEHVRVDYLSLKGCGMQNSGLVNILAAKNAIHITYILRWETISSVDQALRLCHNS